MEFERYMKRVHNSLLYMCVSGEVCMKRESIFRVVFEGAFVKVDHVVKGSGKYVKQAGATKFGE